MEQCAFCSKEADTEGTSVTDCYCIDCHRLAISESKEAIKRIQSRSGGNRAGSKGKTTKEEYDNAFNNLVNPPRQR